MNKYHGFRDSTGTCHVTFVGAGGRKRDLPPRLDLYNHSLTFEWGYGGSGPAQLALALLAHATGDDELAVRLHQRFKWRVINGLDRKHEWFASDSGIRAIAAMIESSDMESDNELCALR